MIINNTDHYIVSGDLTHKNNYQLTDDISIQIEKQWETNLRERNPQIGIVEAVPLTNPLDLKVGDQVVVHHFTFYGDIDTDKGFMVQDHHIINGKPCFKALCRQILFKLIDGIPQSTGDVLIATKDVCEDIVNGMYIGEKEIVTIVSGNSRVKSGTQVITEPHALYPVQVNKVVYYKIYEDEIVATVVADEAIAFDDTIVVKDIEPEKSTIILIAKSIYGYSEVIEVGRNVVGVKVGDIVYNWVHQGLKYNDLRLINSDNIIGIAVEPNKLGFNLRPVA